MGHPIHILQMQVNTLTEERDALARWKAEAIAADFPRQEIARALDIGPGLFIPKETLPRILKMKTRVRDLEGALRELIERVMTGSATPTAVQAAEKVLNQK